MTRGEKEEAPHKDAESALRQALFISREEARRYGQNDLTAPSSRASLESLQAAVADYLTFRELEKSAEARRAREVREEQIHTTLYATDLGKVSPEEALYPRSEAGPISRETALAQASTEAGRPGGKRQTAREKTVPLPFSRPVSWTVEDKVRSLRVTITVETLLAP